MSLGAMYTGYRMLLYRGRAPLGTLRMWESEATSQGWQRKLKAPKQTALETHSLLPSAEPWAETACTGLEARSRPPHRPQGRGVGEPMGHHLRQAPRAPVAFLRQRRGQGESELQGGVFSHMGPASPSPLPSHQNKRRGSGAGTTPRCKAAPPHASHPSLP